MVKCGTFTVGEPLDGAALSVPIGTAILKTCEERYATNMGTLDEMLVKLLTPAGALGLLGNLFFTSRFIVQWIVSERRGESVVPLAFWFLSIGGCVTLLTYSVLVKEPILFLGTAPGIIIYTRNIVLLRRAEQRLSAGTVGGRKTGAPKDPSNE